MPGRLPASKDQRNTSVEALEAVAFLLRICLRILKEPRLAPKINLLQLSTLIPLTPQEKRMVAQVMARSRPGVMALLKEDLGPSKDRRRR
jgi:hypothetical protein